jgi:HAD superfamily hydrolase (TIGR01509 family)
MTNPLAASLPNGRHLACARCGTEFACGLSRDCWCGEETAQLPLPITGTGFADCLCRDCLRIVAAGSSAPERWQIDAVLLDMDGTLLDTERVYRTSLTSALTDLGYADGLTISQAMTGIPAAECEMMLFDRYGADFRIDDVRRAFVSYKDDMLRDGLPLKAGTLELLDALRAADCPMAIVTSSSRHNAEEHLALAGIRTRFDTILTRDDVTHGKPDPELYLLAAKRLGLHPQACMAVEDSNPGITAAHAAGTIAIMVPDLLPPNAETRARCRAVLPDLHAVLAVLRDKRAFTDPTRRSPR